MNHHFQDYEVEIKGISIPVKVKVSKGRNIRFGYRDHAALISAPYKVSKTTMEEAKQHLFEWLTKLSQQKPHLFTPPPTSSFQRDSIVLIGKTYRLNIIENMTQATFKGSRKNDTLELEVPTTLVNDSSIVREILPKLLNKIFAYEIDQRVRRINQETVKSKIRAVNLRSVVSRWGSCTSDNNIMLSNRLLLAPVEILDHVIIHELAHTIHMDHSIKFWRIVAQHDPKMREHHRWLKVNGNQLKF
ncbi:MAG: M48 family metallopeptidase [Bacteroidetes bacterium]|nr:M48 family metallopeptidase [Bacteroidota bacterium]MCB0605840.1 DUF45 domain-containing protein [Saprospiraceae bacterium]MCO5279067.1 M48 family metallopeptidase [Saprospiraceae bacterium]HMT78607.1 DUF45 domain-containing protein [Saprospiraceae bacterium]